MLAGHFWRRMILFVAASAVTNLHAQSDAAAVVTLKAPPAACVSAIGLTASSVTGGSAVNGAIMLTAPAPAPGVSITLSSSSPNAQITTRITVKPGDTATAFSISTLPVTSPANAAITAIAAGCSGNTRANVSLGIDPPALAAISLSAASARGNSSLTGTVTLTGPSASEGGVITLQASDLLVSMPAFVTIPAGQTSASFTVNAGLSLSRSSVAITASYGGAIQTALLNVLPGI